MFRANKKHMQSAIFTSVDQFSAKQQRRLKESWAGVFYREFFRSLEEEPFAVLYSDKPSRPNIPVNVLVSLEVLKAGFGWSDEEAHDAFVYNLQVRYALGYRDIREGEFDLRTIYNFRQRLSRHMQETGENLIEKAFEQVADEQVEAFQLKTGKLRMDSTQIASNIREMSRLQLLVEVLQRVHRMLREEDQEHYKKDFEPYLQGTSGQYVYRIKGEEVEDHLQPIGELMYRLVKELRADYAQQPTYQMLERVFQEHFTVDDDDDPRPRQGKELSAGSLQSPDDWEATYRRKNEEGHRGYVANLTETCDPENKFQLINKVQVEPNNTEDADMLEQALPDLKERTEVKEIHTDGAYGSPDVDEAMREAKVEQIQTAIRGRKPPEEKLGLEDFGWEIDDAGRPTEVTCPHGQRVEVQPGRKEHRYLAYFDSEVCNGCPFSDQCPTEPLKRKPRHVLRFSQRETDLALRRQRSADVRASRQNLRAAAESTMRSVKRPFGNGKLPVRGKPRVSMMFIASAAMTNIRRIHGYQERLREEKRKARAVQRQMQEAIKNIIVSFWGSLQRGLLQRLDLEMAAVRLPI
jgi:anti-sigma28 factor (negative regulator of flagellin synthesis)